MIALDASESMKGLRFDAAREAVKGFLDRLNREDEFTVIGFNDRPFNISPWSANRETILAALAQVEAQGYTSLYSAVSTAIDGLRGSRNRRQALVVISDGSDQLRTEPPGTPGTRMAARQRAIPAIGDELRLQYVIGFAPANPGDGKFHKVQVTVSGCPKCRVRARAGYIGER